MRVKTTTFKPKIIVITIAIIFVAAITTVVVFQKTLQPHTSGANKNTPDYKTVLPKGKTIDQLGGWNRVSPSDKDPVYAYTDTLDGVTISVSEQPLPNQFKDNVDAKVTELAKSYNATTDITAGSVKAYLGTSSQGPQSVILVKNETLVLIKSEQKINDASWKEYVASLN